MLYMIFGGSGSGKSEYAEDLAVKLCPGEKIYLATLQDIDEEMEKRIKDHRAMRKGKHFTTVEQGLALETLDVSGQKLVLLECMTNLLANEMYSPKAQKEEPVSDYIMERDPAYQRPDGGSDRDRPGFLFRGSHGSGNAPICPGIRTGQSETGKRGGCGH